MSVGLAIIRILLGLYLTAHGLQKATPRLGFGGIAGAAQDFAKCIGRRCPGAGSDPRLLSERVVG